MSLFFSISEPNLMIRFTSEQFDALHFQCVLEVFKRFSENLRRQKQW